MNIAFYTGRSGLRAYQNGINIAAQNITNANTTAYKYTTADFRELVYNRMDINANIGLQTEQSVNQGHGVKVIDDSLQFTQGNLQYTGYELDYAIAGTGLFAVERAGEIQYTRDGTFDISIEDEAAYLVTSDGAYVLDENYQRIDIPVGEDGLLETEGLRERLGVFNFDNPYGLYRIDGQSFTPTEISGEAVVNNPAEYEIKQQWVERSNTNLAKEMSDVIVLQKAYQFSAKVVQTADEVEDIVNNLRR
ncbi:MAG: flagellar hook-basal body protein [Oscillospiraceae bacterium]|nr:flagellar hook-basal body protein [Oscillospiraceae bacterium]MBQ8378629.1 flagellar hook-basal body protein [Oscillospiraceae bacterium]MBQ8883056.1 flagellar hook-basal body protein [Oscillospiraceae bacterium]